MHWHQVLNRYISTKGNEDLDTIPLGIVPLIRVNYQL